MGPKEKLVFFLLIFIFFGFGVYKLTESPPTWIDEGMTTQLALNIERYGVMGLQTSPGNFVSGAYISVGFPVTLPLAGMLKLFGEGLFEARILMVAWILLLALFIYLYILKEFGIKSAVLAGLLIATFAPLYGNGKNVLGEVPGLVFFFLFLLLLRQVEKKDFSARAGTFFLTGLVLGLAVVTKPIFLLALGAVVVAYAWSRWINGTHISLKYFSIFGAGVIIPLIIWFFTQFFSSDSFRDVFAFYRNPYDLKNLSSVMAANLFRFFSEISPLYTALLFGIWAISVFVRERTQSGAMSIVEKVAFVFSLLVLFFYLRTPGWYRYFFPAQIIILAFLPQALFFLESYFSLARRQIIRFGVITALLGLVLFQAYQTGFSSWVADYYDSTRTSELTEYFTDWNTEKSIFVYNAPETVIFFPKDTEYYQFLEINKGRTIGQVELERISRERMADAIVFSLDEEGGYPKEFFPGYTVRDIINRYVVLEAKK